MSGGVDSTAAALLLKQEFQVEGFFMELAQPDLAQQRQRAQDLARQLAIRLHCIDLAAQFERQVLVPFSSSYQQGQTPNPCMICNPTIKFGHLLDQVLNRGMEAMATGHYARIFESKGSHRLAKGRDDLKDQSYFLARLDAEQLGRVRFPLGELSKEDAHRISEQAGLPSFQGQESQDVCFLEQGRVAEFLKKQRGVSKQPGEIVDREGHILGEHQGLFHYTIGQRRGLGLTGPEPWYVTGLDAARNQVQVGRAEELFSDQVELAEMRWHDTIPGAQQEFEVKLRHCRTGGRARIVAADAEHASLQFIAPQRAVTPGQFAVIYDQELVLASGIIQ